MSDFCCWCDAQTDHASTDHPTWLGHRRLPLGKDGAAAVLAELQRRQAAGWGGASSDGGLVERLWIEADGNDWWLFVHFTQGSRRYEYRLRHRLDTAGVESSPESLAADIMNCVVDEPHGPTDVSLADGRYVLPLPQPLGRTAGIAEPRHRR